MAITYTWAVTSLKTTTQSGYSDVVVYVGWTKTGVNETGVKGEYSDTTRFWIGPDQENFVPFDQLTESVVLSWVQASVGEMYAKRVDDFIERQITEQVYPVVPRQFPWDA